MDNDITMHRIQMHTTKNWATTTKIVYILVLQWQSLTAFTAILH